MFLPSYPYHPKVVALAGGVGGARMADGLSKFLPPDRLTVIVNVGDDFEHLGLKICPDLDTICYTLAGLNDPEKGWGRFDESWHAMETIATLGGQTWFQLGDRDLGMHIERTYRMRSGQTLSQITSDLCRSLSIHTRVLPVSDVPIPTLIHTSEGILAFQEYFVRMRCEPTVIGFEFKGIESARPAEGVLNAIDEADLIVICPSNPWVSIDPILAVPGIRDRMRKKAVVAVSPIIEGRTVKGPAAKMYAEMGIRPSPIAVARHYQELLKAFVLDCKDENSAEAIQMLDILPFVTNTLLIQPENRKRFAAELLQFCIGMIL